MSDWRQLHGSVIHSFLLYLNSLTSAYVLKGGTALMCCYNLDRFSEDIDLDSNDKTTILKVVDSFCRCNNFTYRVGKDTDTVKRYFINYGNVSKPLKIEVSYRLSLNLVRDSICAVNNIIVYSPLHLLQLKLTAFSQRDKVRDLYVVLFLIKQNCGIIPDSLKAQVINAFSYKGIDYVDYLIKTQSDELVLSNRLYSDYVDVLGMLGMM